VPSLPSHHCGNYLATERAIALCHTRAHRRARTSIQDLLHVGPAQVPPPAPQTLRSLCRCQNVKGEEFVVSWVLRGASSVLPKKRSGCAAFQQLMTMLEHPYVMPCVAAAYVAHLVHISPFSSHIAIWFTIGPHAHAPQFRPRQGRCCHRPTRHPPGISRQKPLPFPVLSTPHRAIQTNQ
jgi:hypothetical protein